MIAVLVVMLIVIAIALGAATLWRRSKVGLTDIT